MSDLKYAAMDTTPIAMVVPWRLKPVAYERTKLAPDSRWQLFMHGKL